MKLTTLCMTIIMFTAVACNSGDDTGSATETGSQIIDIDGDGAGVEYDCNDNDASLNLDDVDGDGYSTCDGDCDDNDAIGCVGHPGGGGMILITAGTFEMGCTTSQQATGDCGENETSVHSVTLTHDFYMGETEVTQAQHQLIMGTNQCFWEGCGADCPMEDISWNEMAEYANALSSAEGLTECFTCENSTCTATDNPYTCDGYRLPTEAEWEYAARAGNDYLFAGSNTIDDVAWYSSNSEGMPHPVAQKAPNDWGLYDMSGNVWEWTWDWYDEDYYSSSPSLDPEGPTSGTRRVARGGFYGYSSVGLRVSNRSISIPSDRYNTVGFRLVRSLP